MALSLAQKFINLGMPSPLAVEFANQLNTGVYNWKRLMWNSMVPELAKYVAESLAAGTFDPRIAMEKTMSEAVATLTAGGGVPAWVDQSSLIDADFANSRYFYNGAAYSQAGWLAAIGGSIAGNAVSVGPTIVGPELIPDGGFDVGVGGWADSPSYAASGDLSVVGSALRATLTGATTQYRASLLASVTAGRAYLYGLTLAAKSASPTIGTAFIDSSTSADLFVPASSPGFNLAALPQSQSIVAGAPSASMYVGIRMTGGAGQTPTVDWDTASLKEVVPYLGYSVTGLAFSIDGATPAAASGNKVLAQWGEDGERNRVRLVWDASKHLRFIVTVSGSEVANLDMGVVEVATAFTAEGSIGTNRIAVRLGSALSLIDTAAAFPGLGKFWIGRSYTGETWDGTIGHLKVFAAERIPADVLYGEGDSYMALTAGVGMSASLPVALGRPMFTTAAGGSTLATEVARVQANPGLCRGTFVHWDGDANSFTDVATTMANYAAMVAALPHQRFVIVPPCRRFNATAGQNAAVTTIQSQLAALYPGHIVDAQAILAGLAVSPGDDAYVAAGYIPNSCLTDGTHITLAAMNAVAAEVASLITSSGW